MQIQTYTPFPLHLWHVQGDLWAHVSMKNDPTVQTAYNTITPNTVFAGGAVSDNPRDEWVPPLPPPPPPPPVRPAEQNINALSKSLYPDDALAHGCVHANAMYLLLVCCHMPCMQCVNRRAHQTSRRNRHREWVHKGPRSCFNAVIRLPMLPRKTASCGER
jgi:hypothetical protein